MPVPCPRCNRPVADGKLMCMYCGAAVVKMEPCPHCKVKNPATVATCQYCHRAMRAAPSASPSPSAGLAAGLRSLELLEAGVRKGRFAEQECDDAAMAVLRQAIAHQRRGDGEAAMPLALTVLAQFPGDPAAWLIFGGIFLGFGDTAAAMRCAELSLLIAPGRPELAEFRETVAAELRRKAGR
jgi:hypothetical protein